MKTINLKGFIDNFLEISNKLTPAEIQMLYLLITEPDVIKISQQNLANKIGVDRRTVNIGLKKLEELKYISDKNITGNQFDYGYINSNQEDKEKDEKFVIDFFKQEYYPDRFKSIIVQSDFYTKIAKQAQLPLGRNVNRNFIKKTVKKYYPDVRFYWQKEKANPNSKERKDK